MTEKDKSNTIKILEAIDTLIIPKLEAIEKDVKGVKEDTDFLKNSNTRIELKLDNEVKRNDDQDKKIENLNVHVLKLEPKKA